MVSRLEVYNFGKLPAFVKMKITMSIDDKEMVSKETGASFIILMPSKTHLQKFTVEGDYIADLLSGAKKLNISLYYSYTDDKNVPDKYWMQQKFSFDPSYLEDKKKTPWVVERGDFK